MYEALATVYDLFMGDVTEWVDFALKAVKGKRGIDVGCGSGKVAIALSKKYEIIGLDCSPQMLSVAAENCRKAGVSIELVHMDAENLKIEKKVDFVTAMCDVVNYMRNPEKFFRSVYNVLNDDGILVFDISSEYKLRKILANNVFTDTVDDVTYIWENALFKNRVDITMTFFIPDGNYYIKKVETQSQYIHKEKDIVTSLRLCGFNVSVSYGDERIYFIANKESTR